MREEMLSFTNIEVLNQIPVNFHLDEVLKRLRMSDEARTRRKVKELLEIATNLIAPKAVYKVAYVENKKDETMEIDKVVFKSRVLRKNLEKIERVFPYIVTIGKKLEDKAASTKDLLEKYYLEEMADLSLQYTREYLEGYIQKKYRLDELSKMNPGSLKDWPITEQKKLFSLFGDSQKIVGVTLTDNFLMIPRKSTSGVFFPTEIKFYSCQLCPREKCIRREAPYDPKVAESYNLDSNTSLFISS